MWVLALYEYTNVYRQVKPLQEKAEELRKKLQQMEQELQQQMKKLEELNKLIEELKAQHAAKQAELAKLKKEEE